MGKISKREIKYFIEDYGFLMIVLLFLIVLIFVKILLNIQISLILGGLILSFLGSFILVTDTTLNFRKEKTSYYTYHPFGDNRKKTLRSIQRKDKVDDLKIGREEVTFIISLALISLGFFLQILGYLF